MADIVDLANFRDVWSIIERHIREIVSIAGHDTAVADWVVADFKKRDIQIVHATPTAFDDFPPDVRPYLGEMSHRFKDAYGFIMAGWLMKIALIEIDLYLATHAR